MSRIVECRKRPCKDGMKRLEKKYKIRSIGFDIVIQELKQDIVSTAQKIKQFTARNKKYRENRMFGNNQRVLRKPRDKFWRHGHCT